MLFLFLSFKALFLCLRANISPLGMFDCNQVAPSTLPCHFCFFFVFLVIFGPTAIRWKCPTLLIVPQISFPAPIIIIQHHLFYSHSHNSPLLSSFLSVYHLLPHFCLDLNTSSNMPTAPSFLHFPPPVILFHMLRYQCLNLYHDNLVWYQPHGRAFVGRLTRV